jgi:heterodisulfide reductase subunit B
LAESLRYVYFPGCSLHATAKEYDISSQSACSALGIKLEEIKGWNCCGATALPSLDYDTFTELNTKNLQLAAKQGTSVVTPCNECFKNLKDTKKTLASKENAPNVEVRHLFQAIYEDVGMENLAKAVKKPLKDLKIVSYYGCLLTRTDPEFDDIERPVKLDEMAEVLGATGVPSGEGYRSEHDQEHLRYGEIARRRCDTSDMSLVQHDAGRLSGPG